MSVTSFEALPLAAPIHRALRDKGYETPSPIQAQAIPLLLEGRDLLGCAQTGTGKTAAFALPIINKIHDAPKPLRPYAPRALVLTPTRELAVQVGKSFETYGAHVKMRHALVFGGVSQVPQVKALQKGVDVLVATPGRLLDLLDQRYVDLTRVEFFVLDEVDRMLDMGFIHDVRRIVKVLPRERQSLFFSATLAPSIVELAETILRNPARVSVTPETATAEKGDHRICYVDKADKAALLTQLVERQEDLEGRNLTLVFSRTKHGANKIAKQLVKSGIRADAIHGNKSQSARQRALEDFRSGRVPVLVATDVAARGIDIKNITLVVNYDLPNEPESYVHRIGRTARAGAEGLALSFCPADELSFLREIERLVKQQLPTHAEHDFHSSSLLERYERFRSGGGRGGYAEGQRQQARPQSAGRPQRGGRAFTGHRDGNRPAGGGGEARAGSTGTATLTHASPAQDGSSRPRQRRNSNRRFAPGGRN